MRYGEDYGIKVDIPWYIRCPIINRFFNTYLLEVSLTTFTRAGGPMVGVHGTFRVPYKANNLDIGSLLRLKFAFPRDKKFGLLGYGLYAQIKLVDVNHRKVVDARRGTNGSSLYVGFNIHNNERSTYFCDAWYDEVIDLKFGKRDFRRKTKEGK